MHTYYFTVLPKGCTI